MIEGMILFFKNANLLLLGAYAHYLYVFFFLSKPLFHR